jgi:hypothetical protein
MKKNSDNNSCQLSRGFTGEGAPPYPIYVDARAVARQVNASTRHIQKLASIGKIPSIRLGTRKGLRFDLAAVIHALEGGAP